MGKLLTFKILWNGFYIGKGLALQNKIKYLFARAMPVLKKLYLTEAGMRMKTFTPQFFISNLL